MESGGIRETDVTTSDKKVCPHGCGKQFAGYMDYYYVHAAKCDDFREDSAFHNRDKVMEVKARLAAKKLNRETYDCQLCPATFKLSRELYNHSRYCGNNHKRGRPFTKCAAVFKPQYVRATVIRDPARQTLDIEAAHKFWMQEQEWKERADQDRKAKYLAPARNWAHFQFFRPKITEFIWDMEEEGKGKE